MFLTAPATPSIAGMFLPLILMVGIFYFLLIRPENKKKKEANAMRESLKIGDNITTIGGLVGNIVSIKDDNIVLETSADKVRVEYTKWAVSSNNTADAAAAKAKEAALAERKKEKEAKKKK